MSNQVICLEILVLSLIDDFAIDLRLTSVISSYSIIPIPTLTKLSSPLQWFQDNISVYYLMGRSFKDFIYKLRKRKWLTNMASVRVILAISRELQCTLGGNRRHIWKWKQTHTECSSCLSSCIRTHRRILERYLDNNNTCCFISCLSEFSFSYFIMISLLLTDGPAFWPEVVRSKSGQVIGHGDLIR